jgi:hypothetical protein
MKEKEREGEGGEGRRGRGGREGGRKRERVRS